MRIQDTYLGGICVGGRGVGGHGVAAEHEARRRALAGVAAVAVREQTHGTVLSSPFTVLCRAVLYCTVLCTVARRCARCGGRATTEQLSPALPAHRGSGWLGRHIAVTSAAAVTGRSHHTPHTTHNTQHCTSTLHITHYTLHHTGHPIVNGMDIVIAFELFLVL